MTSLFHKLVCLCVSVSPIAAPVPKDNRPPVAPPPRVLVRMQALTFSTDPNRRHETAVSYGEFGADGPKDGTFIPLAKGLNHVTVDPKSKTMYGIYGHHVCIVAPNATTRDQLPELELPKELTELSWPCGITFDSKRERVVLVSLGGKGHMYTYSPKTDKWTELTDMNNLDLVGLTYCERADVMYGLYMSHDPRGNRGARLGTFDPVTGRLKSEVELADPQLPVGFGQARGNDSTVQIASVGNHVLMLTESHLFRLELKTNKITVEWKK